MFDILLDNAEYIKEMQEHMVPAKIIINSFSEKLYIPISYWNIEDYITSWTVSLEKGILKKKNSVLLTTAYNLEETNFLQSWVLYYSSSQEIYIQNQIFFLNDYDGLNFENINNFVLKRETVTEDGDRISEWKCSVEDIFNFYTKLKRCLI